MFVTCGNSESQPDNCDCSDECNNLSCLNQELSSRMQEDLIKLYLFHSGRSSKRILITTGTEFDHALGYFLKGDYQEKKGIDCLCHDGDADDLPVLPSGLLMRIFLSQI